MIKIKGYGKAVGKTKYLNDDLKQFIDTNDQWISSRTGIKQRFFSYKENTSDLATEASLKAIESAGITTDSIDIIIVATMTPDSITPSTAAIVLKKLNINNAEIMVFDINVACSGFVNALDIATKLLNKNQIALVIGAEVISKILNFEDRNTLCLFGDGAGALIIEKTEEKEYQSFFNTVIDKENVLFANGLNLVNSKAEVNYLQMNGKEVFKFAINACTTSIKKVNEKAGLELTDIDLIIPHQANYRIIKAVARDLKLPIEKFYLNVENYGNTSAASIPIAIAELMENKMLKEDMKIVLVAFGAGLSMGSILLEI
jgi:3-oxoacyl-[acyl-carrier-protein] synthase-3